jgi:hypothetical protein
VNGDGASDLWLFWGWDFGGAGLVLGPSGRWGRDQDVNFAVDATWRVGPASGGAVADFDTDGFSDAAFYIESTSAGDLGGKVELIRGGEDAGDAGSASAADISIDCSRPYGIAAGDVTGDGLADLLVARGSELDVALLDGQDLPGADGTDCEVLAGTFVVRTIADRDYSEWGNTAAVVGDWTGDGIDDWVGVDSLRSVDHDREGALYLMPGRRDAATLGTAEVESVASASLLGGADLMRLGNLQPRAVADVNGDGALELATTMGTPDARVGLIVPSAQYTGLGGALPREVLRLQDPSGAAITSAPSLGDYDGDGFLDVLVTSQNWGSLLGRTWLVSGAGIPWDDPSAW